MWFEEQTPGRLVDDHAPSYVVVTQGGPWAVVTQPIIAEAYTNLDDMGGLFVTSMGSLHDLLELAHVPAPEQMLPLTTERTQSAAEAITAHQPKLRLATIDGITTLAAHWAMDSVEVFVAVHDDRVIGALYPTATGTAPLPPLISTARP